MAAAKQEKELSVEERLKALYQLQETLTEVDRIKTLRGCCSQQRNKRCKGYC